MPSQGWVNTGKGYWAFDRFSQKIRVVAQQEMPLLKNCVRWEPVIGKQAGDTIKFLKIYDLNRPVGTPQSLSEFEPIPEYGFDTNQGTITVKEYGASVPITELFTRLSDYSPMDQCVVAIKNDQARVLEDLVAAALKSTYYKYTPTGTGADAANTTSVIDTDGTVSTAATRALKAYDLHELMNYASDVLKLDKVAGGSDWDYDMYLTRTAMSKLIQDSDIKNQIAYIGDGKTLRSGKLAVWNGLRFVIANRSFSRAIGTNGAAQEAMLVGGDSVAGAMPLKPEVRRKTGQYAEDYGRDQGVAWYGIFGFALTRGADSIDVNRNMAACIHVTST